VSELLTPRRGHPVWSAALLGREGLDETALFEPADRPIQRAWAKPDADLRCDVLGDGITMLRPVSETGENHQ
jgi:hypothetical protein